jgi:DNA (cytosine-5)-methyltransferase 1
VRTYITLFAGGNMTGVGLGPVWRSLFANDFDQAKRNVYIANFGGEHFKCCDVAKLTLADLPPVRVDLLQMSPPCKDISAAGPRLGLKGSRSNAFWAGWNVVEMLAAAERAPWIILFENVDKLLTSGDGKDLPAVLAAFEAQGYVCVVKVIDARHFVPQSRKRVFIIAVRKELGVDVDGLVKKAMTALPICNQRVIDILDPHAPCRPAAETAEVLALMAPLHLAKIEEMRRAGHWVARTYFRRRRPDGNGGKIQRAEIRDDEIAGALRTAEGGSSRQSVIAVNGAAIRTRLLTPGECRTLMGLPSSYKLPSIDNDAYDLLGDGLVAPIVTHLATHVFEPILAHKSNPV